jgi:hypothetical protein
MVCPDEWVCGRTVRAALEDVVMGHVYLLTEGDYSDYHIYGIFSTRAAAEEIAAESPDLEIEEYELDALVGKSYGPVWRAVIFKQDGRMPYEPSKYRMIRHPTGVIVGEYDQHFVVDSPISAEHAVKVAIEKRQGWLRNRATIGGD